MPNKWNLDGVSVDNQDNMTITGDLAVTGDLTITGDLGLNGGQTYTVTAASSPSRVFNPATATLNQLMDFVATLAKDLVG